ncbi:MAG: T9SS type A sorting domain-containing protein, partial [Bacteroidota bacterium]
DELYGLNHQFNGTTEELRLAKVNVNSGDVTMLSTSPTSIGPYLSGNSDIDAVNRKYYYATNDRVYTIDLDNGEVIHHPNIIYPMSGIQFTANLTYDWQQNLLYCLHFLSVTNPDPFGDPFSSELRLATIDPETGVMSLISEDITSNDGFSMGDCDIDPSGGRYFYIRQNILYVVSLSDGSVLSQIPIDNPNGAIAPIINMSYDDLTILPTEVNMDWDQTMNLEAGEAIELNAWVGDEADYLWQDGSTSAQLLVSDPGAYSVTITKADFVLNGSVRIESETVSTNDIANKVEVRIFPNPTNQVLQYNIEGALSRFAPIGTMLNSAGQLINTFPLNQNQGTINVSSLPAGNYSLQFRIDERLMSQSFIILR